MSIHWFSLLLLASLSDVCWSYGCYSSKSSCRDDSTCLSCSYDAGRYCCSFRTYYITFIMAGIMFIAAIVVGIVLIVAWRKRTCCFKRPPPPPQQQPPPPPYYQGTPGQPQPFFYAPVQPQPMATHQQQPVQQAQPDTQPQEAKSPNQEQGNEMKSTTVVPSETQDTLK